MCICLPDCLKWEWASSDDFPTPTLTFVNVFVEYPKIRMKNVNLFVLFFVI